MFRKPGTTVEKPEKEDLSSRWKAQEESTPLSMEGSKHLQAGPPVKESNLRISRRDLIYFIGELAIMFETGLNLLIALECLAKQAKNLSLERLVTEIRASISEGSPLWLAMKRHPRVFSPVCVSMVRAGEASGTMGEMLTKLEEYLERQDDVRNRVRSALSYPVFMLVISTGVLIFLLCFVFPKFELIFKGNEDKLPAPTRFFLGLSWLFSNYWYAILLGVAVLAGLAFWCWRQKEIKARIDPVLIGIPLFGTLLVKLSLSRSFHTLALMLRGGIPTLEALNMARDVSGNQVFRDMWKSVTREVENGRDITAPLAANPNVPPSEVQMISMGDRSGELPTVLTKLSKRYDKEIDLAVKSVIRFVEPTLVICMGFLVGMIVLSLILPIFAMSRAAG